MGDLVFVSILNYIQRNKIMFIYLLVVNEAFSGFLSFERGRLDYTTFPTAYICVGGWVGRYCVLRVNTICTGSLYVNLTQARGVREEGSSIETMPAEDPAVGKPAGGIFLISDCRGPTP